MAAPGFHGHRSTPNERRALLVAAFMIFAMQMACESRTREADRKAQAAYDAQVTRDAQAVRADAANANVPRVESGLVQAVQAVLLACFLLYVLYELARACYSFLAQLLYDRRIALEIAVLHANLAAHQAPQPEPPAIVKNLTMAAEERLPAIANIPTDIVNRPSVVPLVAPLVATAISPTVDGDEGTQGASKKRGSTSSAANNSKEKRTCIDKYGVCVYVNKAANYITKPEKKAASAFLQSGDKDGQTGVTKCARSDPPEVAEFLSADMYGGLPALESASEEEEVYQTRGSAHCHFFVNC